MPNPFERAPGGGNPERVQGPCPNCGGRGKVKEDGKEVTCRRCSGTGKVSHS
jgi:DnaJ-class molecular chaperone